jgi:hypothetical protein
VNFTRPIGHAKVAELARVWLPDIYFHEVEMFHVIDLEELYTVPAEVFAGLDPSPSRSLRSTSTESRPRRRSCT